MDVKRKEIGRTGTCDDSRIENWTTSPLVHEERWRGEYLRSNVSAEVEFEMKSVFSRDRVRTVTEQTSRGNNSSTVRKKCCKITWDLSLSLMPATTSSRHANTCLDACHRNTEPVVQIRDQQEVNARIIYIYGTLFEKFR